MSDSSDSDEMSPEDFSNYVMEVEESEGFHVSSYERYGIGLIMPKPPYPVPGGDQKWRERYEPFAKKAIENQNKKENTSLEFSELVRVNTQITGYEMYYMTFKAKNTLDGTADTYEAKVCEPIGRKPEDYVLEFPIFRKKDNIDCSKKGTNGVDFSSTAGCSGEHSSCQSKTS